ncbi:type II toxin-antitoxin system CcdA family antitoxin [Pseudanabaena sp. FACHB-2040]|uniref:type II toxin-antitoxin system CcdA family antitoxin n=1 Tax=Pseudanabaena sp. FACHB-2040 TaxID=2692859 RepID=UPI00168632C0|nr:type II toxin-antitoxin system CcdA family antitoxin [Pseudanabaena sp. FACHB-2040]MBD2257902.1 type II toxin-antitoxin system CcdA family antitoxin [Pseudanabaena sp. FACHB-2040]
MTTDDKVDLSIQLDRELLEEVSHLTSDPSKVIEVALRQWLKGGRQREDELARSLQRNPTIPPKGEWND